ncbi:MAG: DUF3857 domain-containing protein [Spirochaetia bacterium]|jgi:hypothetical protein|nr:DUF3857 domain-containing protein [Spirochaetia bacterium]
MKKTFCVLSTLFFLYSSALFAADVSTQDTFTQIEDEISRSFAKGDYHGMWKSIKRILTEAQDDWRSSLYYQDLRRFADIVGREEVFAVFEQLIKGLDSLPAGAELNARRVRLLIEYDRLKQKYNPSASALQSINSWRISGPYKKYGKADMEFQFAPELPGEAKEGQRVAGQNPFGGYVNLQSLYPQSGIAYASASIVSDKPVLLHILCESPYVLFINRIAAVKNTGKDAQKYRIVRVNNTGGFSAVIKMESNSGWSFKAFATDTLYNPIDVTAVSGAENSGDASSAEKGKIMGTSFGEQEVFPLAKLQAMEENSPSAKALKHLYLAAFYDELDSLLAIDEYRLAASLDKGKIARYYYAAALYWFPDDGDSVWRAPESRRIMASIYREDPSFVPSRLFKLMGLIEEKNISETLTEGMNILKDYPGDFMSYLRFLAFLDDYGYEKEFADVHGRFVKNFPDSIYGNLSMAAYQKKRNPAEAAREAEKILKVYKNSDTLFELIKYHTAGGRYKRALELLDENKWLDSEQLRADILAAMGDFSGAKKIFLKAIAKKSASPQIYYKTGLVEYLDGGDPAMYWQTALTMDPSLFYFKEYFDYITEGTFNVPLRESNYAESADMRSIFASIKPYDQPSRVLSRNRIFMLEKNAGRVFCQDVIHLNNEKGIESWGEFRIPYSGRLHPVIFRVYYADGTFSDTYSVNWADSAFYVNLVGLRKNSILVMQYIVDNTVPLVKGSEFYSLDTDFLQSYEEPLDSFKISVIAAQEMRLSIQSSGNWTVTSSDINKKKYYSFAGENLPAVYFENYSGSGENMLPWYGFSTVESSDDLALWYAALMQTKSSPEVAEYAEALRGKDTDETVRKVYDNISREILLSRSILYYPDTPRTVLYRKSGSVEDKVITAREILSAVGIVSYPALVRSKTRPVLEKVTGPDYFDSVLLYVPMSDGNGYWLDFSNRNYAWGTLSPWLTGQDAWISAGNSWEKKKITGESLVKNTKFLIDIDAEGNGSCRIESDFPGIFSAYRRLFSDKQKLEDGVNYYCGGMFPTFSLNKYLIENADNYNEILKLKAEGTLLGIAAAGKHSLIFEPVKSKSSVHQYIAYPSRSHSLIIPAINENEIYEYKLPQNFTPEGIDKEIKIESFCGYAKFKFSKEKNADKLTVAKEISVSKNIISPEEYAEFLDFCMKIHEAEAVNIILHSGE